MRASVRLVEAVRLTTVGAGMILPALDVVTIYWHFLAGLWIYLRLLLFFFAG